MIQAVAVEEKKAFINILDIFDRLFIYAVLCTVIYGCLVFINIVEALYDEKITEQQRFLRFV